MYICSIACVDATRLGHINNVQGAERHCRCFSSIKDTRMELKAIDSLHQEVQTPSIGADGQSQTVLVPVG